MSDRKDFEGNEMLEIDCPFMGTRYLRLIYSDKSELGTEQAFIDQDKWFHIRYTKLGEEPGNLIPYSPSLIYELSKHLAINKQP